MVFEISLRFLSRLSNCLDVLLWSGNGKAWNTVVAIPKYLDPQTLPLLNVGDEEGWGSILVSVFLFTWAWTVSCFIFVSFFVIFFVSWLSKINTFLSFIFFTWTFVIFYLFYLGQLVKGAKELVQGCNKLKKRWTRWKKQPNIKESMSCLRFY